MKNALALLLILSVPAFAAGAQPSGNPEAAKGKISMCIGCHGIPMYKTAFPAVYPVPMIAGQSSEYIVKALHEYRAGERSHPTMRAIAGGLSDQDIADVAAYYGKSAKAEK